MTDKPDILPARVFISCGQTQDSDEYATAKEIARRLKKLQFDPYVALQEQSLSGLKENIFRRLENSEYFIFVDFKREELAGTNPRECRGSLFSHQELALASYLNIEVLAFQEKGVRQNDGIIRFLQANATQFTDRHLLPNVIADEVGKRRWDSTWRNELLLERSDPTQHGDSLMKVQGQQGEVVKIGHFFHIGVHNRHQRTTARHCFVYLEKAVRLEPQTDFSLRAVEVKWEGYTLPSAHIPPGTARTFDAFYIFPDDPVKLRFQLFTDSWAFIPNIEGEGRYELQYSVVADNFPTARDTFLLDLRNSVDTTTLTKISKTKT